MTISEEQINNIKDVLRNSLRKKFANYNPEPAAMPFHARLLGKDRLALYSFIHSLSTNFGTSIFEPVAVALGSTKFKVAKTHITAGNKISEAALYEIQKIMDDLTAANTKPDKIDEFNRLKHVSTASAVRVVNPTKVDIYLESENGEIFFN